MHVVPTHRGLELDQANVAATTHVLKVLWAGISGSICPEREMILIESALWAGV